MAQTNPEPTTQTTSQVTVVRAYEKQTCTKKTVVRLKVNNIKSPPPRRMSFELKFNDGSSKIVTAFLESAYGEYAYYDLSAQDAREVYPKINMIESIKVVEE